MRLTTAEAELSKQPLGKGNLKAAGALLYVFVYSIMVLLSRLNKLASRFLSIRRPFSTQTSRMAQLDIKTQYKMLSGYEIPALGFGVRSQ